MSTDVAGVEPAIITINIVGECLGFSLVNKLDLPHLRWVVIGVVVDLKVNAFVHVQLHAEVSVICLAGPGPSCQILC